MGKPIRFSIEKKMPGALGRAGTITTPHGEIRTPAFVTVGTKATVKALTPEMVRDLGAQVVLANTYHLYLEPGERIVRDAGGIHKFMNWSGPTMTDSGGFQVMSLAKKGSGKVTDEGVSFYLNKKRKVLLTPEKSIDYQLLLNTDLLVVLDDFTPPGAGHDEAKVTVARTIAWAKRSKAEFDKQVSTRKDKPYLIGVVQGGYFADLRRVCLNCYNVFDCRWFWNASDYNR